MGHCNSGSYAGKQIEVAYFLGCTDLAPAPEDYKVAGWRRGAGIQVDKEEIDTTTAGSEGSIRTKIQTFTEITGTFDGIAVRSEDLKLIRRYIMQTPQADGWVRYTIPDVGGATEVIEVQCMFSSYSLDGTFDDSATNDIAWSAVAVPIFTDVPAVPPEPAP